MSPELARSSTPIGWTPKPDIDRTLFASDIVEVGQFRCPVSHPLFADCGPTRSHCFVFPREPVWIRHEGEQPFVADSTVIPFYNPGVPYRREGISPAGDRTDWFSVSHDVLRDMLRWWDADAADHDTRLFRFGFGRSTPRMFLEQRRVFERVRNGPITNLAVEESVVGLLASVLTQRYGAPERLSRSARHRELVEDVRAHLSRTFASGDGLRSVAGAVGASVFHLCRVFRQYTGTTVHRYRHELRLRKALELVSPDDSDLLEIALEMGYSGHSHFTRAFHDAFGMTPSEFRAFRSPARPAIASSRSRSR